MNQEYYYLRSVVRGAYDIQKLRIQMGNRIVGNFKVKLGIVPGQREKDAEKEAAKLLKKIKTDYDNITDAAIEQAKQLKKKTHKKLLQFKEDGIISNLTEYSLINHYVDLRNTEEEHFKNIGVLIKDIPIYKDYLKDVPGIGPALAAIIITEIDIHKATYSSSIWQYAGLSVGPDGKGMSKRKEHLVKQYYIDKEGNKAEKMGITFNPFLKTKLVGVMSASFIRMGPDKSQYAKIYYDYKNRLENHVDHKEKTKLHRHRMAIRYMVKRFIVDLYAAWRKMEGLPVADEYAVAKLGIVHSKSTTTINTDI